MLTYFILHGNYLVTFHSICKGIHMAEDSIIAGEHIGFIFIAVCIER
jgi:hypothetical protein